MRLNSSNDARLQFVCAIVASHYWKTNNRNPWLLLVINVTFTLSCYVTEMSKRSPMFISQRDKTFTAFELLISLSAIVYLMVIILY
jgi:hypothetical protein